MSASSEARADFFEALERVRSAMQIERRAARADEIEELEDLWWDWDFLRSPGDDLDPREPWSWEVLEDELRVVPPAAPLVRIHPEDLAALSAHAAGREPYVHVGRGYVPLPNRSVKVVVGLLQKRRGEQRRLGRDRLPASLKLSYEAIAGVANLSRDRVKQIEGLIAEGWDPRESHPQFPARSGYVNLPTIAELKRLRRYRLVRD
jgi:hypothetical protein